MKKYIYIIIAGLVIAVLFAFVFRKNENINISKDTYIDSDYSIPSDKTLYLRNNAKLVINGDFDLKGDVKSDSDVQLVVHGNINISDRSKITANGNIFITDSQDVLNSFIDDIDKAFEEAGTPPESGNHIGPFTDGEGGGKIMEKSEKTSQRNNTLVKKLFSLAPKAQAQTSNPDKIINISGIIQGIENSEKPNSRVPRLIALYFPTGKAKVNLKNLKIISPRAPSGRTSYKTVCRAEGGDGKKGLRITLNAWSIEINDAEFHLADGGNGGDAYSKDNCTKPESYGGNGGKAGNLKITAQENISISGTMKIFPGAGGHGGNATAIAKDAEKGKKGNDALAQGGKGADNNPYLSGKGKISGIFNIEVGKIMAGSGGDALAKGGRGGDAEKCGQDGFDGGIGKAIGGNGGNTYTDSLKLSQYIGGNGGNADGIPGSGGNGADACDDLKPGGNGGDVPLQAGVSRPGEGGTGDVQGADGETGELADVLGANSKPKGGDGGDGCPPGVGGASHLGEKGKDGKNTCPEIEKEDQLISDDYVDTSSAQNCEMPIENIAYAFPEDAGYTYKIISENTVQVTRNMCISKSASSLKRGTEAWVKTWPLGENGICPKVDIEVTNYQSLGDPCTFVLKFKN